MTKTSRRIALAIALSLCSLPCATSLAQQPTKEQQAEAATRFRKGIELYKEGDYRAALIEFKRAHELAPNYSVLYNIGNVYFQLQDYANALASLEAYLAQGAAQVPSDRRTEVEKDIEKLRTRVARLDITANVPDAEVSVDDIPVGKTPFSKPLIVNPGRHKITATKEGRTAATKVVEVASFDMAQVQLELAEPTPLPIEPPKDVVPPPTTTAAPPPPPPPPPPPEKPTTWPGWAVAGALVVGGGITGGLALGASGDLKTMRDDKSSGTVTKQGLDDQASKAKTLALVSDILLVSGVVAGGVTLFFTLKSPSQEQPAQPGQPSAEKTGGIRSLRVGISPTGGQVIGTF